MNLRYFILLLSLSLLVAGCSAFPGLRVLTGEDTGENAANRVVEELDLVMADKTGATDPSLMAAADRIEAASGSVDIIEIRQDPETDTFVVYMLYLPPQVPQTLEGQAMLLDSLRRAMEITWQGVLPESVGADNIHISLLEPGAINTLDQGQGMIGIVAVNAEIGREDAAAYLSGTRNLDTFYSLIVNGQLTYQSPQSFELYEGTPNHPMFMVSQLAQS